MGKSCLPSVRPHTSSFLEIYDFKPMNIANSSVYVFTNSQRDILTRRHSAATNKLAPIQAPTTLPLLPLSQPVSAPLVQSHIQLGPEQCHSLEDWQ